MCGHINTVTAAPNNKPNWNPLEPTIAMIDMIPDGANLIETNCRRLGSKFLWLRCNDPIFYCGKEMAETTSTRSR